jgi:hypothetical protein
VPAFQPPNDKSVFIDRFFFLRLNSCARLPRKSLLDVGLAPGPATVEVDVEELPTADFGLKRRLTAVVGLGPVEDATNFRTGNTNGRGFSHVARSFTSTVGSDKTVLPSA